MKVQTDLRAGNVIADATQQVQNAYRGVSNFFQDAQREANAVANTANSIWKSVTGLF